MMDTRPGVAWDLTSFFPEFNGPEMKDFKTKIREDMSGLARTAAGLDVLDAGNAAGWESVLLSMEDLRLRLGHLGAYVGCLTSTYTNNEAYKAEGAALSRYWAEYLKIEIEVLRAFKDASSGDFEAFMARDAMKGAENSLRRTREKARKTMTPDEEKLAADLGVDGFHAWQRLYNNVSGKLEFDMEFPGGEKKRLPISQWRALMANPDRKIGKAAFDGGNKAWQGIEDVCAAALNAISGTRLTLYKYRGIDHFLDKALFHAAISKKTLDAMYSAIYRNIETPREVFRAKAGYFGRKGIHWFEREAPLPLKDLARYSWDEATGVVVGAFRNAYPHMADYFKSFLEKRWLESEARPNKSPGAYCSGSNLKKEQRVFMTFTGETGGLRTMAHEMGHAFHSYVMNDLRPMAREVPMTLAETASILGEHILCDGLMKAKDITDDRKLIVLDTELNSAAVMLLDITVRFEFEKALHDERAEGELTVQRLKELMADSQRKVFGDCMIEGSEDPYFWASKLHFYITGTSFYNFPYTFGFLLARAMYARFQAEGPAFLPKYEEFLRNTGSDTVENVVMKSIGEDVSSEAFWEKSIRGLDAQLTTYKRLLASAKGD